MTLTPQLLMSLMDSRPRRIGEVLMDQELISEEDLGTALIYQKAQPGKRLGTILQELGLVSPLDLMEALMSNLRVVKSYSEG